MAIGRGKSALEAISVTRRRCWDYDWVVEFDIRGLFDNLDHGLLMMLCASTVRSRGSCSTGVERWLKAPMQTTEGEVLERQQGTPQGGVVSPILANLFCTMRLICGSRGTCPASGLLRYADDAVLHCKEQTAGGRRA